MKSALTQTFIMILKSLWILGSFTVAVVAIRNSCPSGEDRKYHSKSDTSLCFKDGQDLPYLLLPYGDYRAASYDSDLDVTVS